MPESEPEAHPVPTGCGSRPREPLKLHDLLVDNVNTWGNVQYNIPLRSSSFETRTGTSIAHRFIPPIPHAMDCKISTPLPVRVTGRDMVVEKETYKTTSGEYCTKPNPNKAMERADCAINCRRVGFMTGVEKRIQSKTIRQPILLSEMKDNFRGLQKSILAPPETTVKAPDPEYIFDLLGFRFYLPHKAAETAISVCASHVGTIASTKTAQVVAAGRNEAPCIPETATGFRKLMDPYVTTYRLNHRPFTPDDQMTTKDQITFYSESKTPKCRGFGPRHKECWMPLQSKRHKPVYDVRQFKTEYKEVAAAHNPVDNIKGVFESETKRKYKVPFAISPLASWSNQEMFDLAPYPPNPYQTTIAPFMYCSDYCHIAQGTPPCIVIDQIRHDLPVHKPCVQKYVVSRDFVV